MLTGSARVLLAALLPEDAVHERRRPEAGLAGAGGRRRGRHASTDVEFAGEQVDVTFEVNEDRRTGSRPHRCATLGSVSLLGESAVDITPSLRGTPIPEWGYVPAGPPPAQLRTSPTRPARASQS